MKIYLVVPAFFFFILSFFAGCTGEAVNITEPNVKINDQPISSALKLIQKYEVKKWLNGKSAAVSLTYDSGWCGDGQEIVDAIKNRNLAIDFEVVTAFYNVPTRKFLVDQMAAMRKEGFVHFYGHGHEHIQHDNLTYDSAFASFQKCFNLMKEWNLQPKAYAYPGSSGKLQKTQDANKNAGFICARGVNYNINGCNILPENGSSAIDWYFLPSVFMSSKDANAVVSHAKLVRHLVNTLNSKSWTILMYHSIGIPDGYAYYPLGDFMNDLETISENDFWCDHLDNIALYIKERQNFRIDQRYNASQDDFKIKFYDNMDNDIYDQVLTVEMHFVESIHSISVSPSLNGKKYYNITNGKLILNILPNEQEYTFKYNEMK